MYIYDMKIIRRIIAIFLIFSTASGVIDELTKYGNLTDDAVGGVIIAIIIVYFLLRNPKKKSEKTQIRNKDSEIVENLEDLEIETTEIKNTSGVVILPAGLEVDSNYSITFYDDRIEGMTIVNSPVQEVTNYLYEQRLQDDRRNIFLLKPRLLNVVRDDLEEMMLYKKGSTQYKSETLKTADNIRLFQ